MSDNRIISTSKYNVTGIDRITATDNNLTKRPHYTRIPTSNKKSQNNSDSFDDTSHSNFSHNSSNDDSKNFSNELENKLRLKSEENLRLVQSKFNQNTLNDSNSNSDSNRNIAETELHNKLSQAMTVEVDTSTLCKKIELLHSLKK